jgi:hypothetical protein
LLASTYEISLKILRIVLTTLFRGPKGSNFDPEKYLQTADYDLTKIEDIDGGQ